MKTIINYTLVLVASFSLASQASAGIYSNDLSKCLVESSTQKDKNTLVRWMFTSIALHPEVRAMSGVSEKDFEKSNRDAAMMFMRLLTETCKSQAEKAIQYEGNAAIQQGFGVFGQVAGRELFAHPDVSKAISGLEKYIDRDKIRALGVKPANQ